MNKRDVAMAAVILLGSLAVWAAGRGSSDASCQLTITVDGEVYGTYALDRDQVISIGDTNVCQIQDGQVTMTEADCPDQICVKTRGISREGGTIVCLPNRIVLEITGEDHEGQAEQEPDTVAS